MKAIPLTTAKHRSQVYNFTTYVSALTLNSQLTFHPWMLCVTFCKYECHNNY